MELFRSLRIKAGTNILRKKSLKVRRRREFVNITKARTIGIVWDIVRNEDLAAISDFILKMNERGIRVDVIGIFHGNLLPDNLTALRYINCLKREDLSYTYRPKTTEAEAFMNSAFDILIEISFRDCLPVRYLSTLTPARCRVCCDPGDNQNRDFADIMISTGNSRDVRGYLNQVVTYLEIINN
jgi:hypothetical protein